MTSYFSTPLRIGKTLINSRVMLAPMAGVTDLVFRGLVRRWAPDSLVCTEMISSNGMVYASRAKHPEKNKANRYILASTDCDHPLAYQLAAHQEDILLEAADQLLAEHQPVSIDLNMGCPVKKITGNFEGCALMKEPEQAQRLIHALVKHVPVPVTVKFRLGWDMTTMNYLDFGKRCQDAGASMVTLHARTRSQGYAPGCRWEAFGELKQVLDIPVIANGDIQTIDDVLHLTQTYGVDGVMIGRAALGEPWLIGQMDEALKTGIMPKTLTLSEKFSVAVAHAETYVRARGVEEERSIRDMRKNLAWYAKDFPGASICRGKLTQVNSVDEVRLILAEALDYSLNRHHPLAVA